MVLLFGQVALSFAQENKKSSGASSTENQNPVEISADGENRYEGGIAYADGNVSVRYGEDIIDADQITYDKARNLVTAQGNVRIYSDKKIYRGDFFTYDLQTKKVTSHDFVGEWGRIYATGKSIDMPDEHSYLIRSGYYTIDNREHPTYKMKAHTTIIYPDDRIVCRNVTVYIADVPVMWLPYVEIPIGKQTDTFQMGGGSSSYWGFFVSGAYTTALGSDWTASAQGTYYSRRGFGGGLDFDYQPKVNPNNDVAHFSGLYVSDGDPSIGNDAEDRSIIHSSNRYRVTYQHRYQIADNLITMADINVWSDRLVTEDFAPNEYRNQIQPDNYASMNYYDGNFMLTLLGRIQANNLFNVSERKPEFTIDFKRQDFFGLPIDYEGQTSAVNFSRQYDRDLNKTYESYSSVRYDSFHQFSYPRQYFGWLSLVPMVGVRGTYYMDNNNPYNSDPSSGEGRFTFNAGLNASFKISRTWTDIKNPALGIDGIRHIIQPYVEAAYILPVGMSPDDIRGFDAWVPNTRLTPLDQMMYNSVDSIDKVESIKQGIRNRIQTKRDGLNYDLFQWDLYTQANFTHTTYEGILSNATYSQVYNDISFRPVPWLNFNFYSSTGVASDSYDELLTGIQWQVHPAIDIGLWYNRLRNVHYDQRAMDNVYYPYFNLEDADLVSLDSHWRLNENWSVGEHISWDFNIGRIQEQRYSVYRDLSSWILGFTVGYIDNGPGGTEFLTYFTVTLKAFPKATIHASVN